MSSITLQIDPVLSGKTAVAVEFILDYKFFATDASLFAKFLDEEGGFIEIKRVYVPPEVYAQWLDTDQFLIDYAVEQLGIKLV